MNPKKLRSYCGIVLAVTLFFFARAGMGQQNNDQRLPAQGTADAGQLEQRMNQLLGTMDSMRKQLDQSQREMEQMRAELKELKAELGHTPAGEDPTQAATDMEASVRQLQEQNDVQQAEVKQHEQTKLESLSKYPVRISGMVLFTSQLNTGTVDDIDVPIVAVPKTDQDEPAGNLSATARQTILGLQATGPSLWGAQSSADINIDFFGGTSYADYSTSAGLLRLRTAHANLDWPHRSLAVAFDRPLISPLQPTSFLSVGEPALAWSGNLWTWVPQLQFKDSSLLPHERLGLEAALVDVPSPGVWAISGVRTPSPSEKSQQPGYEARFSSSVPIGDRTIKLGAGGYYSRQAYQYDRHLDAWAGTADWEIPVTRMFDLSGEFYRGRGIGGLGGGTFKDYVPYSNSTAVRGLDAVGGWGQLKAKITRSFEANFAIGEDNAYADDFRASNYAPPPNNYANLSRNRTGLANVVYRPKTYLLFSAEYKNIYSWPIAGQASSNQSVGFAAGYLF
jgi:Skp family chaperone for outer membrane proteins